jgi:hypothetical protein
MSEEVLLLVAIGEPKSTNKKLTTKAKHGSDAVRGVQYEGAVVPDGGVEPFSYEITGGTLPAGVSLDNGTGAITGKPLVQGFYQYEVTVTDAESNSFGIVYGMTVEGGITWETKKLPNASANVAYKARINVSGGSPDYFFEYASGWYPFNPPMSSGDFCDIYHPSPVPGTVPLRHQFTLKVTDEKGNFSLQTYSVIVWPAPQWLGPAQSDGLVGLPFEQRLDYRYGDEVRFMSEWPTPTFSITSGALPPGLALSPTTGTIHGTPTTSGTYFYTVQMTDSLGASISSLMRSRIAAVTEIDQVYEGVFGDGVNNTFDILHMLGAHPRSVIVYDNLAVGPMPVVDVEWSVLDSETINVTTARTPDVDQYRIIITG